MKTARKAILLVLCAILLVVSAVMGTLAYLTAEDVVTNTFTVGKIEMTLDEAKTDEYGVKDTAVTDRVQTNEYKLIPGHTYDKDPQVHVVANSEDCWVFVNVENGLNDAAKGNIEAASVTGGYQTIHDQIIANGWTALGNGSGVYFRAHEKSTEKKDYDVFKEFKINGENVVNGDANEDKDEISIDNFVTTKDDQDNITGGTIIKVTAYAIQQDGFTPVTADGATTDVIAAAKLTAATSAWNALQKQLAPANPNP